jgi:Mn2+/Fe2+ NRAMP family transporter
MLKYKLLPLVFSLLFFTSCREWIDFDINRTVFDFKITVLVVVIMIAIYLLSGKKK